MAVYTTVDEVREILSRSALNGDHTGTAASLSDAKITLAIEDAQGEVDSYIGMRYSVPLTISPVPALVRQLARNAAAYYADIIYRQGADYDTELDPVYLRYKRAVAILEQIRDGKLNLDPDEDPTTPPDDSANGVVANKYTGDLFVLEDFALGSNGSIPRDVGWF